MHSTNALEHNPLLLKPPHKNSKETHNFGTKLRHFAQLSITNTTMPHKPEDKNSNLLHNLKSQLRRDSLKLMMKMLKEPKDLDYDINKK